MSNVRFSVGRFRKVSSELIQLFVSQEVVNDRAIVAYSCALGALTYCWLARCGFKVVLRAAVFLYGANGVGD